MIADFTNLKRLGFLAHLPQMSLMDFLRTHLARYGWLLVLGLVGQVYYLRYYILPDYLDGVLIAVVAVPALWVLVAAAVILLARFQKTMPIGFNGRLVAIALIIGLFQVAAYIANGLFGTFGYSPHASNTKGILTNVLIMSTSLVGIELARAYLLTVFGRRNLNLAMVGVSVLFALILISPNDFSDLRSFEAGSKLAGQTLIPNLAQSFLTSYLAVLGGPLSALVFRGVVQGFELFSPILPVMSWFADGLVGGVAPLLGYMAVNTMYAPAWEKENKEPKKKARPWAGLIILALMLLALIPTVMLSVGFRGYKAAAIVSPSMYPLIKPGDMVITGPVEPDSLQKGDIIKYRRASGMMVVHRIVGIKGSGNEKLFVTKGDNNNAIDIPDVKAAQIEGKVIRSIPLIGMPSRMLWAAQNPRVQSR